MPCHSTAQHATAQHSTATLTGTSSSTAPPQPGSLPPPEPAVPQSRPSRRGNAFREVCHEERGWQRTAECTAHARRWLRIAVLAADWLPTLCLALFSISSALLWLEATQAGAGPAALKLRAWPEASCLIDQAEQLRSNPAHLALAGRKHLRAVSDGDGRSRDRQRATRLVVWVRSPAQQRRANQQLSMPSGRPCCKPGTAGCTHRPGSIEAGL